MSIANLFNNIGKTCLMHASLYSSLGKAEFFTVTLYPCLLVSVTQKAVLSHNGCYRSLLVSTAQTIVLGISRSILWKL